MSDKLQEGLKKAGIDRATKHLFLCIGPDCCSPRQGEELWEHVKRRVKDSGAKVMRTKAGCFRICTQGPWLVVYPEGIWYSEVTPARFDVILREHILGGNPITQWMVARNSLGCAASE